jgi:hypothetical protein
VGDRACGDDGDVHGTARHQHLQRLPAAHRGRPRHQLRRKHLGADQLPGRQRDHPADERVAQPRLRPQALLHDVRRAIHRELFSLRRRTEPGDADRVPRAAGDRRRRPRAGRTGDIGRYFPQGKTRRSFRALQHGDGHGTGHRASARRMDHRQLLVAVGFLYQRPDRAPVAAPLEPDGTRPVEFTEERKQARRSGHLRIDYVGITRSRSDSRASK